MSRVGALWLAVACALGGAAAVAAATEWTLATGRVVYVPTRPRDPRSLVQGDFHRLRYDLPAVPDGAPRTGELALTLDARQIVTSVRPFTPPLSPDEVRIDYAVVDGVYRIAPSSFLIEEGTGAVYDGARHAELRVGRDGRAVLVRLRDRDLAPLGPAPRAW